MSVNDVNLQALSGLPEVKSLGIVNNVALMYLNQPVDLRELMREYSVIGADFQDRKFPSVIFHFAEDGAMPHSTVKVFGAGKLLCPGCATWDAAMCALSATVELIRRVYPTVRIGRVYISNVVGCMALWVQIDLALLNAVISSVHESNSCMSAYDTKDFSGIRFRDYETGIAYLIFWTGNVIITNGKHPSDVTAAAHKLYRTFAAASRRNPKIFTSPRKSIAQLFRTVPDRIPPRDCEGRKRARAVIGDRVCGST
jgi:TATA-box binding protein (TBP) (component of TFIID and TFIIIB)